MYCHPASNDGVPGTASADGEPCTASIAGCKWNCVLQLLQVYRILLVLMLYYVLCTSSTAGVLRTDGVLYTCSVVCNVSGASGLKHIMIMR